MTPTRFGQGLLALESLRLSLILRVLVGGTLVFSGTTKMLTHTEFVDIVDSYHILPHSLATAYGVVMPWVELIIGAYLVLGILIRPSAFATILIGISFMVANVTAIARGEEYCGSCFGEAVTLSPWQSLVIDILIMVAALYLIIGASKGMVGLDSWANRRSTKIAITSDE